MRGLRRAAPLLAALLTILCGCASRTEAIPAGSPPEAVRWEELSFAPSLETVYADQFSVSSCPQGYREIEIGGEDVYLLVPEGMEPPEGVPEDVAVLRQPLDSVYLVATSAMDLFRQLDAIGQIALSGTDASGWYIPEAREAMEAGEVLYAGKYDAPDYELILASECDLAVESTMIYHTPEVKEQLERFGVPVLVERSSYEGHPLGRMEWIRLYGVLLGREAEAEAYFSGLLERLAPILERENTGKTAAFFYITSNGAVNVRRPEDYIARSIGLAGGVYLCGDLPERQGAQSTANVQIESFYQSAREADVLIYNSAINGELETVDQLLEKCPVLRDFKAVETGQVWRTGKDLFQASLGLGDLIEDLHAVFTEDSPQGLSYLHHLD